MPDHAFLSYTKTDKAFAERLATDLKKAGLEVWFAPWKIRAGESIVSHIDQALADHRWLLIVVSPAAMASAWVRRELNASLMRSLSEKRIGVIPVLSRPSTLPAIINDIKYADFTLSYDHGFSELLAALGVVSLVPAYTSTPQSIQDVAAGRGHVSVSDLFPSTFTNFPHCLFQGGILDVAIVLGATEREHTKETKLFRRITNSVRVFGTNWSFKRQVTPGTVRDGVRIADLCAHLGFKLGVGSRRSPATMWPSADTSLCMIDISVVEEDLHRNLILVGGADTNILIPIATIAIRQRFGVAIPIRYQGDDQLYFTCDQIHSDLSGYTYSRLEDLRHMHCGFLVMIANPWEPKKVIIFVVGTRATGTQAALLALIKETDTTWEEAMGQCEPWHRLSGNNRFNKNVPAKVVRATRFRFARGGEILATEQRAPILAKSRISQRHIITNFEFCE